MDGWIDRWVDRWLIDRHITWVYVYLHTIAPCGFFLEDFITRNIYFLIVLEPGRAPAGWVSVRPLPQLVDSHLSLCPQRDRERAPFLAAFLLVPCGSWHTFCALLLFWPRRVEQLVHNNSSPNPPALSCALWTRCGPLSWGSAEGPQPLSSTSSRRFY